MMFFKLKEKKRLKNDYKIKKNLIFKKLRNFYKVFLINHYRIINNHHQF